MYYARRNTFRISVKPVFNEIVNRFLSEPFKDQILTLQNGRNNCSLTTGGFIACGTNDETPVEWNRSTSSSH
jgi:hypothetical protein